MSKSKQRGTAWETAIVRYLNTNGFPQAERRALRGNQDRGDIAGVIGTVIEAKSVARLDLAGWITELEQERANDGAAYAAVWAKRRGTTDPGKSYVLMTGNDFVTLLRDALGIQAQDGAA